MLDNQPLYVSVEGLCDSSSESESEEEIQPEQKKSKRFSRKLNSKYYNDPDYDLGSPGEGDGIRSEEAEKRKIDDKIVALSKKQLNRLAAMEIYPIPSGGIGTVNASLFNPVTIKWLMKNFETVEGSSLPRYLVYNHYLLHCKSLNIKPINAASFGKVIRSVFLGLQTRRLGTRGNSKYHYCGMRIKPDSPLLHVLISDAEPRKHKKNSSAGANELVTKKTASPKRMFWTGKSFEIWRQKYCQDFSSNYIYFRFHQAETSHTMRHLQPEIDVFIPVTDGLTKEEITLFKQNYYQHCKNLLSAVLSFRLEQVGLEWHMFHKAEKNWKGRTSNEGGTPPDNMRSFTRAKLKKLVTNRNVQKFVNELDKQTYTSIAYLLCPHVTVVVPCEVNQIIRNFLAIVEEWLSDALENYPEDFRVMKIKTLQNVMRPLEQTINTNSLYCALQQSFHNPTKMKAFLRCLNQLDVNRLGSRIGWVAEERTYFEGKEMKEILAKPNRLALLIRWIEGIVEASLERKVPMTEFKMHLQNAFLGISCFTSFMKSEMLLQCQEATRVFSCMENFILEYLKYFIHLRTGMQNLIASVLASASCSDDKSEVHSKSPKTVGKAEMFTDFLLTKDDNDNDDDDDDDDEEHCPPKNIKIEHLPHDTNSLDFTGTDKELEDLRQFLTAKKNGLDTEERNAVERKATTNNFAEMDESFVKYFSSSGYVTNYFCRKFSGIEDEYSDSEVDEDEATDDSETYELGSND